MFSLVYVSSEISVYYLSTSSSIFTEAIWHILKNEYDFIVLALVK